MLRPHTIYSEVYFGINKIENPFDVYNDNRAHYGFERAKSDIQGLIVELETNRLLKEGKDNE